MNLLTPRIIQASNLSVGWSKVFLNTFHMPQSNREPALLCLSGFSGELPEEDSTIRKSVDDHLQQQTKNSVAVSGMTIFPFSLWKRRGCPSPEEFHPLCVNKFFPRLKACDSRNRLGTYFERMMHFTGMRGNESNTIDQLGFVINLLKNPDRWPRQSALQLSLFDPAKDHTGQSLRGFPCLQQVGLTHDGNDRIGLHAFYPTQYIFDRGYGNYLGLCHLGAYIAHQANLKFGQLNCYIGDPQLGSVTKRDVTELKNAIESRLKELTGT